MTYLTMAKIEIAGKPYIVCDCRLLENVEACTLKAIKNLEFADAIQKEDYLIVNPTDKFISDLEKILIKISNGEDSRYYRGDYGKYYITDYSKIMDMFTMLEFKAY